MGALWTAVRALVVLGGVPLARPRTNPGDTAVRQLSLLPSQPQRRDPAVWQHLESRFWAWWWAGGAGDGAPAKAAARRRGDRGPSDGVEPERWRWDGERYRKISAGIEPAQEERDDDEEARSMGQTGRHGEGGALAVAKGERPAPVAAEGGTALRGGATGHGGQR